MADRVIRQAFGNPVQLSRTIVSLARYSARLHHWAPNAEDGPEHAHPWSFVTLVLRGGYVDVTSDGSRDEVRAPAVRFRRATHRHRIFAGSRGCLSLVLTGRLALPFEEAVDDA